MRNSLIEHSLSQTSPPQKGLREEQITVDDLLNDKRLQLENNYAQVRGITWLDSLNIKRFLKGTSYACLSPVVPRVKAVG